MKPFALLYGSITYVYFLGVFLYAIGFVSEVLVPKSINSGTSAPLLNALLVNVGILGLFGVQHSIMARPAFKSWWTKIIPAALERTTFVFLTCAILTLLFAAWQPLSGVVWSVENPVGQAVLWSVAAIGWLVVLVSTFLIDHFELFGIKQAWYYFRGKDMPTAKFAERSFYKVVRHPIMLGFLIAFWSTPHMTAGQLLFAGVVTAYVLVALQLEERDLVRAHGSSYQEYRGRVPMLLPWPRPQREVVSGESAHARPTT